MEKPAKDAWSTPQEALEDALELEKYVNEALLNLHQMATDKGDPHLTDFLEANFLDEQVQEMKNISDWITQLSNVGPGIGEHMIDTEINHE